MVWSLGDGFPFTLYKHQGFTQSRPPIRDCQMTPYARQTRGYSANLNPAPIRFDSTWPPWDRRGPAERFERKPKGKPPQVWLGAHPSKGNGPIPKPSTSPLEETPAKSDVRNRQRGNWHPVCFKCQMQPKDSCEQLVPPKLPAFFASTSGQNPVKRRD